MIPAVLLPVLFRDIEIHLIIKKRYFMKRLLVGLMLSFSVAAFAITSNEIPLDKIVAVINSEVITESQLDQRIAIIKQQMQEAGASIPNDTQLRQQVLDQLIDENMQLQIAKRNKLQVTDAQLNQALTNIATRNRLTLDQLRSAIEKQGLNYDAFRKQLYNQMLIAQVQEHAIGPIPVSDQEVNNFLRQHANDNLQYHVQDFLIQPSPNAQNVAQALIQQLRQNSNQALPAGVQAEDLGWRPLHEIPEVFVNNIAQMKIGEIVGPIQAPNGLHVIKLVEKSGGIQQLSKAQIKNLLYQQKLDKQIGPWLKQVRSTAYIKVMD